MRVTEAFIDDIIANADVYTCMPLCADTQKLVRGDHRGLTHMYDAKQGKFLAPMIGAFYSIRKQEDEHGVSLIGTARINKRDDKVTQAIQDLYDAGALKFSFEIRAAQVEEKDGVTIVDAAEGNRLTAMAVVTTPAYPSATALDLAAELDLSSIRMFVWQEASSRLNNECFDILQAGADYAYLYLYSGTMLRMEFVVEEHGINVTDMFEVRFERAEVNNEMNDQEQAMVEETTVEQTAEVQNPAEEQVSEEQAISAEAEQTEPASETAETVVSEEKPEEETEEDEQEEEEEKPDKMAELEAKLNELLAAKAEAEAERDRAKQEADNLKAEKAAAEAAAEKKQKQEKMLAVAERIGLNLNAEAVKAAVEALDYEALMAEVPAKATQQEVQHTMSAEFNLSPYGRMFEKN